MIPLLPILASPKLKLWAGVGVAVLVGVTLLYMWASKVHLQSKLNDCQAHVALLELDIKAQNDAIDALKTDAEARQKAADKALKAAREANKQALDKVKQLQIIIDQPQNYSCDEAVEAAKAAL